MEKPQGTGVRERYERVYVIELAYAMAPAPGLDVEVFRGVMICDTMCIGFLRKFIGFPDFFVYYTNHSVARVWFKTLVDLLDKARVLAPEFVSSLVYYATRKRIPYATINAITKGFVRVGVGR